MTSDRPAFVLHDHRKPRPHFDLRLEEDGVLRSWAVPRGLPSGTGNHLAVAVPDHGLDHLTYTDEDKSIADIGWWEELDRTERRLLFVLHGREHPQRFALIHTDGQNWLLHRTKDQPPDRRRSGRRDADHPDDRGARPGGAGDLPGRHR